MILNQTGPEFSAPDAADFTVKWYCKVVQPKEANKTTKYVLGGLLELGWELATQPNRLIYSKLKESFYDKVEVKCILLFLTEVGAKI